MVFAVDPKNPRKLVWMPRFGVERVPPGAKWDLKATPAGPVNYAEIGAAMDTLYNGNFPPFLYVQIDFTRTGLQPWLNNSQSLAYKPNEPTPAEKRRCTAEGYLGCYVTTFTPVDAPPWYIDTYSLDITIKTQDTGFGSYDYIKIGDALNAGTPDQYSSEPWWWFADINFPLFAVFAHKSIVRSFEIIAGSTGQFYTADVSRGTDDSYQLYQPLGSICTPSNTAPAVLKVFMKDRGDRTSNISYYNGATYTADGDVYTFTDVHSDIHNPISTKFVPAESSLLRMPYQTIVGPMNAGIFKGKNGKTYGQYALAASLQEALYNIQLCVLRPTFTLSKYNSIFQGLYRPDFLMLDDIRVFDLMSNFCITNFAMSEYQKNKAAMKDPAKKSALYEKGIYPNICACAGLKGEEAALRLEVENDTARLVCLDPECFDGAQDGGVYTFQPETPCEQINICKVNLSANITNLKNVSICGRPVNNNGPSDATPPPSAFSKFVRFIKNNVLWVGIGVGTVVLVLLIIIIVVLFRKEPRRVEVLDAEGSIADSSNAEGLNSDSLNSSNAEGSIAEGSIVDGSNEEGLEEFDEPVFVNT